MISDQCGGPRDSLTGDGILVTFGACRSDMWVAVDDYLICADCWVDVVKNLRRGLRASFPALEPAWGLIPDQ